MVSFERFLAALDSLGSGVRSRLNPPASTEELDEVASLLPAAPPEEWRELYGQHDGEGDNWADGTFFCLKFLPLADVRRVLDEMQDHLETGVEPDEPDEPDPRIAQGWPSLGLLPLFDDTTGNYLGVDLHPGPEGTFGQVVVFGADYAGARYAFSSLGALFGWVTAQVQAGNVVVRRRELPQPAAHILQEATGHTVEEVLRVARGG